MICAEYAKTYEKGERAEVVWEGDDITKVVRRTFPKPRPVRVAPAVRHDDYEVWYSKSRPDWGPDDVEWVLLSCNFESESEAVAYAESFWPW